MNTIDQESTQHETDHFYQWIGERRHVSGIPYMLPKDDEEIDRLDLQHYMLRYTLKGNYLAPIAEPERILDVGCGTGRWSAEMAREFPGAEVNGIDMAPPATGTDTLPLNCHFQQGNVLEGLLFKDRTFDFVHQRLLLFAIPAARWPQLIEELVRVTRQHGWVELIEVYPSFQHMGPATEQLVEMIFHATRELGMNPTIANDLSSLLAMTKLTRVETSTLIMPCGHWGGRIGSMALADVQAIFQALKPLVIAQTQTAPEDFDALTAEMFQEFEQYHSTFSFHVAYGQRP